LAAGLVLDWSNVVHTDGKTSKLYSRVVDVDNARETVRNNDVNRPAAPRRAANAIGDSIVTDGMMTVVQMGSGKTPAAGPPQLNTR
jgi:hypothetical protein